jgi:predicted O-linked N-acetylglucosamine transferase (SPINDLY family)
MLLVFDARPERKTPMSQAPVDGSVRNDDTLPLIAKGAVLHQAGHLDEAATIYREILSRSPQDFDATHLLGVVALQQGRFDTAQRLINTALLIRPNDAAAVGNLGISYLRDGQLESALRWFEIAVQLRPDSAIALTNTAEVLYHLGRYRSAIPLLEKACASEPPSYAAHNLMGACLMKIGEEQRALPSFEAAAQLRPDDAEACANLSLALQAAGETEQAREYAEKAARLRPDSATALNALAKTQLEQGRIAEAVENYRRGASLAAPSIEMLLSYANVLIATGLYDAAMEQLERARTLDPRNPNVRWALAIGQVKPAYDSETAMKLHRENFKASLDDIKLWYETTPGVEAPETAVGTMQPFFLAYQNYNNRDLLKQYGELCAAFMSRLSRPAPRVINRGKVPMERKLRLGIVSAHIREHSIWRAVTKGWVEHLDRDKFEIHVFHLSPTVDAETEAVMRSVSYFDNRTKGLLQWIEAIENRQLDAILYPEIGIDMLTVKLASLRLAPIQAATWGHPETSGLPTIDLYFSAEAFEPPDAAWKNYCEKLVVLPNLSVYVEPLALPNADPELESLNVPLDQALVLCPGQPFKYAPQYDDVWPRIAKGLHKKGLLRKRNSARLVFFRSDHDTVDRILEKRLRVAFARNGVDFDTHVSIVPFLDHARFFGLMRRSLLMLDTLGFSGFNTALQGIECELPVLAFEGDFMRGRLASGILRELEMPELIATGAEEFVRKATMLINRPDELAALRSRIIERRDRLFRNLAPVRGLERSLLEEAAKVRRR